MTTICPAPDESLGVALRLSGYLNCQAQALGENGFAALIGSPIVTGMLSGAITIFVALIGYRMILGTIPSLRDGIGWAIRLGFVLALSASWPAFQTLVYKLATDGPEEVAAALLPAIGLPMEGTEARIQTAYEAIGRGTYVDVVANAPSASSTPQASPGMPATSPTAPAFMGQSPSPVAASLLVLTSVGIAAALRLAVGFLVAIGPVALIGLLFESTTGLVESWARTLIGAALGVLATHITSALELVSIESEIARAVDIRANVESIGAVDVQGFATIAGLFGIIAAVAVIASFRAAGGLRLPAIGAPGAVTEPNRTHGVLPPFEVRAAPGPSGARSARARGSAQTRAGAVSDALVLAASRTVNSVESSLTRGGRQIIAARDPDRSAPTELLPSIGRSGRRTSARKSRSAMRRDISA